MALGSVGIELMHIKKASIWRVLGLAEVTALKEPKQHWKYTMEPIQV
jgi:hypothetical protein